MPGGGHSPSAQRHVHSRKRTPFSACKYNAQLEVSRSLVRACPCTRPVASSSSPPNPAQRVGRCAMLSRPLLGSALRLECLVLQRPPPRGGCCACSCRGTVTIAPSNVFTLFTNSTEQQYADAHLRADQVGRLAASQPAAAAALCHARAPGCSLASAYNALTHCSQAGQERPSGA